MEHVTERCVLFALFRRLWHNNIGNVGAIALAEALRTNKGLSRLRYVMEERNKIPSPQCS
jgi:hypothetical protein